LSVCSLFLGTSRFCCFLRTQLPVQDIETNAEQVKNTTIRTVRSRKGPLTELSVGHFNHRGGYLKAPHDSIMIQRAMRSIFSFYTRLFFLSAWPLSTFKEMYSQQYQFNPLTQNIFIKQVEEMWPWNWRISLSTYLPEMTNNQQKKHACSSTLVVI